MDFPVLRQLAAEYGMDTKLQLESDLWGDNGGDPVTVRDIIGHHQAMELTDEGYTIPLGRDFNDVVLRDADGTALLSLNRAAIAELSR